MFDLALKRVAARAWHPARCQAMDLNVPLGYELDAVAARPVGMFAGDTGLTRFGRNPEPNRPIPG